MSAQYRREFNFGGNPINYIVGLILAILVLYGLFRLASFVFSLLYYISPLVLIATLIIDYKVVLGYGQWVVDLFKRNTAFGVVMALVTIFAFPVVAVFLLSRALFRRQLKQAQGGDGQRARRDEYTSYEEIESRVIEIPEQRREKEKLERRESNEKKSDYDQFFD